jgi:hypothetical protein
MVQLVSTILAKIREIHAAKKQAVRLPAQP